jgi:hypothetical protein
MRPEIPPPVITIFLLVGTFSDGLTRNKTDIIIKNIPRITLRISCDSMPTIEAPRKLKRMLGLEPIKNPVTGQVHRAIIEIPEAFESSRMEQASTKKLVANDNHLDFRYEGTYGSFSENMWKGP